MAEMDSESPVCVQLWELQGVAPGCARATRQRMSVGVERSGEFVAVRRGEKRHRNEQH